jgi:hypothetical protein
MKLICQAMASLSRTCWENPLAGNLSCKQMSVTSIRPILRIVLNNQIVYVCTLCPLGEYGMLAKKMRERPCQTGREKSWGAFHCVCILQLLLLVHRFQVGHAKMLHSWLLATKKWLNLSLAEGAFSLNPEKTWKAWEWSLLYELQLWNGTQTTLLL